MDDKRPPSPRILKIYDIINPPQFKADKFEVREDGQPILWVTTRTAPFEQPRIELQSTRHDNPVVAAAKLIDKSNGCRISLGNPAEVTKPQWDLVACESVERGVYHLTLDWRTVRWERAPPRIDHGENNASLLDFRLVDAANDQVLLEYLESTGSLDEVAKLQYRVDDGEDMELMGLAALFGILEKIRRSKRKRS